MFRVRSTVPFALTLLFSFAGLFAATPQSFAATPAQTAIKEATSPADLRARLTSYAVASEKSDPNDAGEAWYDLGESWRRGGQPDSAIAAFRRARDLRNGYEDRYALAEALFARQAPGDIDAGVKICHDAVAESQTESAHTASHFNALLAWGELLAGDFDASRTLFASVERDVTGDFEWRYRYGRALLTGPDFAKGIQVLRPLAVASRGQAQDVMQLLQRAAEKYGQTEALDRDLAGRMKSRDDVEERVVTRIQGRRIKFAASDQFPLAAVLLQVPGAGRHHPAIVMMAPEDTLADYDSLGVALRAAGLHAVFVSPRGSGWSVAPPCPLPFAWRGREEAMLRRSARDVRDAVRASALAAKADTSGFVLIAARSMALAGALAAEQDRRVRALVLLSPDPDPVDRGVLVATLAKRKLPVFIQQTMEDYPNADVVDAAYHASVEAASRVSDGHSGGHGAIAFKMDPRVTPRFVQWLSDALTPSPRPQPRKG